MGSYGERRLSAAPSRNMNRRTVDKNDPTPRYLQVRHILEESVRTGKYRPGAQLPGERELAQTLQVSQMTVNKAIQAMANDGWLRREIGKGTFVLDDFRPPPPAVMRVGFAVPVTAETAQEDYYLGALLRGIQRAVSNEPISLTILETPVEALYERLMDAPIDGCLLIDVLDRTQDDVLRLAQAGRRMVILGADQDPLPIPYVDSDNYGGTRAALEHLIELGHRRIAGIFAYRDSCNTRQRLRAYRETLEAHDITVPDSYCIALGNIYPLFEPLHKAVAQLLAQTPRPTAFFCGGYYLALETIQGLRAQGVRIPEEFSVVGFDDPISASYFSPPLTTVAQPLEEMGQRATRKLVHWLHSQEEPEPEILPVTLRIRGSSAPAPTE